MKYKNVKNPKWANAQHSVIVCDVDFDDLDEEYVQFAAVASGDLQHTHEIFARCVSGDFGQIAEYTPPQDIVGNEALANIRAIRNNKLATEVDPVVSNPLRWADMTSSQQQAWSNYRRDLLNITTTYPNPAYVWNEAKQGYDETNIVWPVKPQ